MGIVNLLGGNVATIGSQFHYVPLTAFRATASRSSCRNRCCRGSLPRSGFHALLGFTAP
ncbi:hypothetical protein KCP73_00200 [Salmonella enterica subsp. enterica]|nr:hypothetical protein KCP73_00200 [Salmonella enterica subsp. enterica]